MPIMAGGTQSNTRGARESGQNLTFPMGGTKMQRRKKESKGQVVTVRGKEVLRWMGNE